MDTKSKATAKKAPAKEPVPKKPAPKKKAASKKATTKRAASKKPAAKKATPPKPRAKRREVDTGGLSAAEAKKRCAAIYALEADVTAAQDRVDLTTRASKSAKASLKNTKEALAQEIEEQRFGPGPLFDAEGKGPA